MYFKPIIKRIFVRYVIAWICRMIHVLVHYKQEVTKLLQTNFSFWNAYSGYG